MKPYCSRTGRHCQARRGGRKANRTFEPSSGGIGRRLKTISTRLISDEELQRTVDEAMASLEMTAVESSCRIGREVAQRQGRDGGEDEVRERPGGGHQRLAPAAAREVGWVDGRRLGPAEPEIPAPMKRDARSIPPSGSKWATGLSVSRPNSFAVPVAEPIRRQRVGELVDREADQQHDRDDDDAREEVVGHADLSRRVAAYRTGAAGRGPTRAAPAPRAG